MAAAALFYLFAWVRVDAATVYTNGYFKYTVEDHSVTIVSYFGTENEVNVPNMIAGNPVNVIGKGAFARNKAVTMIFLPDTIMSVEEGAFSENQKVEYDDGSKGNDEGGQTNTQSKENMPQDPVEEAIKDPVKEEIKDPEKEEKKDPAENKGKSNVKGIPAGSNSIITVDDDNNLILVGADGSETVLDDSKSYNTKTDGKGNEVIEDSAGNTVNILSDGIIEFVDKDNNKVTVDPETGNKTVASGDGSYGYEEAQIEDEPETGTGEKTGSSDIKEEEPEIQDPAKVQDTEEKGSEEPKDSEGAIEEETQVRADDGLDPSFIVTAVILAVAVSVLVYIVIIRGNKG